MGLHVVTLPDVGEGVVEAELAQWLVSVGDVVTPESGLAEILTDKATVEISSPVSGTVAYLRGDPGQVLTVGSDLVGIELDGAVGPDETAAFARPDEVASRPSAPAPVVGAVQRDVTEPTAPHRAPVAGGQQRGQVHRALASPAVRRAALERGIDLRLVRGSGAMGRVSRADLDAFELGAGRPSGPARVHSVTDTAIRGVRRTIANRMNVAWQIPHLTYVEDVDMTETEKLRRVLNERGGHLTVLPFVVSALVHACRDHPVMSSTFDADAGVLSTHGAVHVGVATQTDAGLVVPVVHNAEELSLADLGAEIARVTAAARAGQATRDELTGSTITVSSLGKYGGVATTPILNHPEVAIVGVNKLQVRPVWESSAFVPRTMMNLSSSFDHRVVDGWDAALFIQHIKQLLESPALMFMDEGGS